MNGSPTTVILRNRPNSQAEKGQKLKSPRMMMKPSKLEAGAKEASVELIANHQELKMTVVATNGQQAKGKAAMEVSRL
jgi:hypothetical protein